MQTETSQRSKLTFKRPKFMGRFCCMKKLDLKHANFDKSGITKVENDEEEKNMKAVVLEQFNDLSSLVDTEVSEPVLGMDEMLVATKAVAVDPIDVKISGGARGGQTPMILGSSVAGEVIAVGRGVKKFKVGDRIAANVRGGETYAEQVAVAEHLAAHVPDAVSYAEAVSVSLSGQTALQAVTRGMNVKAGQHILVHGAAGAVGFIAMQEALDLGATVAVTASGWGADMIRERFPQVQVFDYHTDDYTQSLEDLDAVFDTVGTDQVLRDSYKVLKSRGTLVSIVARSSSDPWFKHFFNQPDGANIQQLVDNLADGSLQTIIDSELPLSAANVRKDYERLEAGGLHGKLILTVD
jgi:NADPH:quinone reductase-like Zn-dependent oxidoreductase